MKRLFTLMLILCLVAVSAQAYTWGAPQLIQHRGTYSNERSDYGNLAVEGGKVGFVDISKGSYITYNEFSYDNTPGTNGPLTKTITGEQLSGNLLGAYGAKVVGISFNSAGQPVVGSAAWGDTVTGARVSTRQADGSWPYTQASGSGSDKAHYISFPNREAFQLDDSDVPYFVYTDITGASGHDIVVASAASSTTPTASWTQTIVATPANPLPATSSSSYSNGAKLAITSGGTVYSSYQARNASNPPGPGFFVGSGGFETATGMFQDTERSRSDIEIDLNGYPMIAALDDKFGTTVSVSFFDGVSYTTSDVVSVSNESLIEHNLADVIDLEIDGQGRPVLLVGLIDSAAYDYAYLDLYTYENGSWTGERALTINNPGSTDMLRYLDLVFDENGRPFISFSARYIDGESQRDAYILTTVPEPATMIMLLGGALGMVIRRKK